MGRGAVRLLLWAAAAAALACAFAAAWLTLPNLYHTSVYRVDVAPTAPLVSYVAFVVPLIALVAGLYLVARRRSSRAAALALAWSPLFANAFTVVRAAVHAKPFFFEPLILCLSAAAAVALAVGLAGQTSAARTKPSRHEYKETLAVRPSRLPVLAVAVIAVAAGVYLYYLQALLLARLSFGWTDVGLNYMRVRNTALGRGFLQETMSRPPFYDHFNPGLAVLVPFYYCLPTLNLVMWAQALFLAAIGPAVYVYAKGRGLASWQAAALGVAALIHPSISQIACSFSYGFHPVTLAMPAVVLSIHFWEKRRWWPFALCAVFAASMEETLFPLYAGVGLVELVAPKGRRVAGLVLAAASVAAFLVVTKAVIPAIVGDAKYFQMAKYSHLGSSVTGILLSPFTKPGVFWGLVFSAKSITFVAIILSGMALAPLAAPRQLLYPIIVLVFVLLLGNPDVKSVSFWYQSLVVAAWLPAAVAGVERIGRWRKAGAVAATAAVVAAAFATSHFYGMLPWSRVTTPFQLPRDASFMEEAARLARYAGTVPRDARVLATMRAATLFCEAGTDSPLQDWDGGTDYDVVVIQQGDGWGQTPEKINEVFTRMNASGEFEFRPLGKWFGLFVRRSAPGAAQGHFLSNIALKASSTVAP